MFTLGAIIVNIAHVCKHKMMLVRVDSGVQITHDLLYMAGIYIVCILIDKRGYSKSSRIP